MPINQPINQCTNLTCTVLNTARLIRSVFKTAAPAATGSSEDADGDRKNETLRFVIIGHTVENPETPTTRTTMLDSRGNSTELLTTLTGSPVNPVATPTLHSVPDTGASKNLPFAQTSGVRLHLYISFVFLSHMFHSRRTPLSVLSQTQATVFLAAMSLTVRFCVEIMSFTPRIP